MTLGAQFNTDFLNLDIFFNLNHSSLKFKAQGDVQIQVNQTNFAIGAGF